MSNLEREHWKVLKCLLRHPKGSTNFGLVFEHDPVEVVLEGYVDSNFTGHKDKRRSTTAYMFTFCESCVS